MRAKDNQGKQFSRRKENLQKVKVGLDVMSLAINYASFPIASWLFRAWGPVSVNVLDRSSRFINIKVDKHRKSLFCAGTSFHFMLIFLSELSLNCFADFVGFFRHVFETFELSRIHESNERNRESEKIFVFAQLFFRDRENRKPAKEKRRRNGREPQGKVRGRTRGILRAKPTNLGSKTPEWEKNR